MRGLGGKISKVAGVVGKVATLALPFTAAIPGVGELVGGVAAGAKAVQAVSGLVSKGAKAVNLGSRAVNKLTD